MCLCTTCVPIARQGQKRMLDFLGLELTDSCELIGIKCQSPITVRT